jgi:hypothetical protein
MEDTMKYILFAMLVLVAFTGCEMYDNYLIVSVSISGTGYSHIIINNIDNGYVANPYVTSFSIDKTPYSDFSYHISCYCDSTITVTISENNIIVYTETSNYINYNR